MTRTVLVTSCKGGVGKSTVAANLTVREREVAKLSAFGFTVREIAARLGISRSYVSRIEKAALDKIRRRMT